ncbi:ankyrin repeat-containing domain protein [Podospora fimiseda]|uniref:Ankyrin repeat-containing domain protein n=1 Tax=Podospora fimiseda TaxID=252190 RepID=A0AAN6YP89_9PEZI|nr:ankyrin repeat-containing domain protein [Podospora fimiseda]
MLIIKNRNKYPDHFVEKILNSRDNDGATPLFLAASIGATDTVEVLLGQPGINVNKKNDKDVTPLRAALGGDHAEPAELLLEYQKVFKKDDFFHQNWNPLCHAAGLGFVHVNKKSAERKKGERELDLGDGEGLTALYLAASGGHVRVVKSLIKAGADINCLSKGNLTPLYGASKQGHARIVEILLGEKGIHLDIRSDEGDNALDIAVTGGFDAVADLLMEYVPPEDEEKVDEKDQENEK